MRFSTRVRYGMQAMLALAMRPQQVPVSVKEIAERNALPEHYLEQLITPLRRAGLVQSARGAQGGYVLAHPAAQISLRAIVEALEGPVAVEDCGCPPGSEHALGYCLEHGVWRKLKQVIDDHLDSRSLADLRDEALTAERLVAPIYEI
ncbi:MAG: Rrf2 family transcriptional regulator [Thermaerobacter sp.]|nr:Rrf2 family transcriptional regulator [Thermaerobacter sp.]